MFFLTLLAAGAWLFSRSVTFSFVEAVHPVRGPAVEAVYAMGMVEATVMLPIAARSQARLVELNADEGQEVKKGDQLARLQDEDLQSAIEELQAKEEVAKKNYDRKIALAKQGYETKTSLDQAHADWDVAVAAVSRAKAEAGYMKLTAPEDGRIIRRDGEIGQMISANQPLFWFSCCAPLRISAEVDEEDIAAVKPGQDVLIRADAFPGKVFKGKVQSITPKGDPISRSYRVRVVFAEETPLQIGMTAETNIIISERQNALLIPSSALDKNNVWLVKEGYLEKRPVTAGTAGATKTEILKGVYEHDVVVLKPSPAFREGKKVYVRIVPQEP